MLEFDITVVGGGPAGAACATLLAQHGASVAIVEASDFTRFRIGETIAPSAFPLLNRLGLPLSDLCEWGLPSAGVASIWGGQGLDLRPSIVNPYGRGWRVDRRLLDQRLFERAGLAGATLFTRSRVKEVCRQAGYWEFSIVSDGSTVRGRAPIVVEATGRNGKSRFAQSSSRLWLDRLVGIAILGECRTPGITTLDQSALVEAMPGGWWYSVYLPENRAIAVFFTDGDLLPKRKADIGSFLREQMQKSELTRARCQFIEERLEHHCWKVFDARSSIRRTAAFEGWVAAGDALMAFDPLSGQGVTEALYSGIRVAEWILSRQVGRLEDIPAWVEQVSARFNDYIKQRLRTYSYEKRWGDRPFWRRRQP